jgi:hypothetical protein
VRLNCATPFVPFSDGFRRRPGSSSSVREAAAADPLPAYTPPRRAASRHGLALLAPASHWFLNSMFANHPGLRERAAGHGSSFTPRTRSRAP